MHSMPNFVVLEGESRHESSAKQQQTAMFVSDILEKTCSFNSFRVSVSTLNHQIFTYFVQRRSFLSSSYHLNLNQAFKAKNLAPMAMHHGRCHWTCALYQILVRMLMQKRPLFINFVVLKTWARWSVAMLFLIYTLLCVIALFFVSHEDYPTRVHPVSQVMSIVTRGGYHPGSSVLEGLKSVTHPLPTAPHNILQ